MANRDDSSLRQEAIREIQNLKRRTKYWEQKYHYKVDIPDISNVKRVTKQFVQKIHDIRYENLTEKQKKEYSRNYTRAYDNGEINIPEPQRPYEPPTESQFTSGISDDFSQIPADDTDFSQEPVETAEEIDAYIESMIDEILGGQNHNQEARDYLENLLWEARRNYGDKGFYEMLQDDSILRSLQESAYTAQVVSPDRNGDMRRETETAIIDFATTLNNGRPLSLDQQEMLWSTQRADIGLYDED